MQDDIRFSRPVTTAERLGKHADDRHRFLEKRILVTGEREVLATKNGRACLLFGLRLLLRICPNIVVSLPKECATLLDECHIAIDPLAFGGGIIYLDTPGNLAEYDAIFCIGATARPNLPWTVVNSQGWLARVSSGSTPLSADCQLDNPIGALAAASLGVAEVFKRLVRLRASRGQLLDELSFSLFDYTVGAIAPGPSLPEHLPVQLLLVGAGAIGNGVVQLLSQLPLAGTIWVVDSQRFGPENLGTCLLIGPTDVGKEKAVLAADILNLNAGVQARGFAEKLDVFSGRLGKELPYPSVILGGVDNIDARHDIQRLWADMIIDGAIGDFGCEVSRHPWGEDIACLMCLFRHPAGEPAERVASRLTGLRTDRALQESSIVTEVDVIEAPVEKQQWLRERMGHQICSVIQEAVVRQLSEEQHRQGFAPSVPFVASLSASMVVAELVKHVAGLILSNPLEPRFQCDVLRGPAYGLPVPQERRRDCICITRRHNIEQWKLQRA